MCWDQVGTDNLVGVDNLTLTTLPKVTLQCCSLQVTSMCDCLGLALRQDVLFGVIGVRLHPHNQDSFFHRGIHTFSERTIQIFKSFQITAFLRPTLDLDTSFQATPTFPLLL